MAHDKEGTLIVSGFFGRGNAGDEAMLQCVFEEFSTRYRIAISLDEHGAHPGYRGWYPYNAADIVHQCDYGFFERVQDGVGFLVGGGGLSMGFSAIHAFAARSKEMRTGLVGVDLWTPYEEPSLQRRALKTWLDMFDVVAPRTAPGERIAASLGRRALHGADWALRLDTDDSPDVVDDMRRALVVLREDSLENLPETYAGDIEGLLQGIVAAGYEPHFLPFSPGDESWLDATGLAGRIPTVNCWWNAKRLKQIIASSGATISVGRLHPCIFGAGTGRIVANVPPPHWIGRYDGMAKVRDMSQELGIPYFQDFSSLLEALNAGTLHPADPALVSQAKERLDGVCDLLHGLFRRR